MQLSIYTSSLAPQLTRFRHLVYLLPPNLQHGEGSLLGSECVNPLRYQSTSMWPLLRGCIQELIVLPDPVMKVVLPIWKLIVFEEWIIVDEVKPILLEYDVIVEVFDGRTNTLPLHHTEVNLLQSLIAASTRSTELLRQIIRSQNLILVPFVVLVEENLRNFQSQLVLVLVGNVIDVANHLAEVLVLHDAPVLPYLHLEVVGVHLQLTHVLAEWSTQ